MAREIHKPGMFCPTCDKPVVAQRNKHGVRNTAATLTLLPFHKVEGWYCPECGGDVMTRREAELKEAGSSEWAELKKSWGEFKGSARPVIGEPAPGECAVRVTALPNPSKPVDSWKNGGVTTAIAKASGRQGWKDLKAYKAALHELPATFPGFEHGDAERLLRVLHEKGAGADLIEGPPPSVPPPAAPRGRATSSSPSQGVERLDPLDRIARLGELRERGLLTQEEFEEKKAELLRRL